MPTTAFTYTLAASETATLKVLVGEGQPGGITILLGAQVLWTGGGRRYPKGGVLLGTGAELLGQRVIAMAVVTNQNPQTGRCSVTYEVKGGAQPRSVTLEQTSSTKGEEVTFPAVIAFS